MIVEMMKWYFSKIIKINDLLTCFRVIGHYSEILFWKQSLERIQKVIDQCKKAFVSNLEVLQLGSIR